MKITVHLERQIFNSNSGLFLRYLAAAPLQNPKTKHKKSISHREEEKY